MTTCCTRFCTKIKRFAVTFIQIGCLSNVYSGHNYVLLYYNNSYLILKGFFEVAFIRRKIYFTVILLKMLTGYLKFETIEKRIK